MPDELHLSLSRRSFLRYSAISSGLLALGQLRLAPAHALGEPVAGLQVLTPREAEIFTAIAERMVASADPRLPRVRDTKAILAIDQALLQIDPDLQGQLKWLLLIVQWGPPFLMLRFSTFTGLPPEQQDEYLRDWATSPRQLRRLAFRALKNLSMLGYYSQDEVWPHIGYRGPWLPRPRRFLSRQTGSIEVL